MHFHRRAEDRGYADFGWLQSQHSFSFGSYQDPRFMGFSALRVINQDIVAAGKGFPKHGHDNMEIISYVLRGAIHHKDSMGHESTLRAGEVQVMSAGTGVTHSEYNVTQDELEFLQIWIFPNRKDVQPRYQQKALNSPQQWELIANETGDDHVLSIQQDALLYRGRYSGGEKIITPASTKSQRAYWLQIISGQCEYQENGEVILLKAGDGLGIWQNSDIQLHCHVDAEFLWFDLAEEAKIVG